MSIPLNATTHQGVQSRSNSVNNSLNTNNITRDILLNSWLKIIQDISKKPVKTQKPIKSEKLWGILCVHNENIPMLEFYESRQISLKHTPSLEYNLLTCIHVSPSIICEENEFAITLSNEVIRLSAGTRALMMDWINAIKEKLIELKVFQPHQNFYTKEPVKGSALDDSEPFNADHTGRNPHSPLPLIPNSLSYASAIENYRESMRSSGSTSVQHQTSISEPVAHPSNLQVALSPRQDTAPVLQNSSYINQSFYDEPRTSESVGSNNRDMYPVHIANTGNSPQVSVFNFSQMNRSLSNDRRNSPPHLEEWSPQTSQEPIYEALYLLSSAPLITSPNQQQSQLQSFREGGPPPLEEGPPPYQASSHQHGQRNSVASQPMQLSLKETQVIKLQKEISHKSGVRLLLRKKDCINTIALVDGFSFVWVSGWKQKDHPLLHSAFHIGDRIMSIGGHKISSSQDAQKVLKQQDYVVEIIVQRVPFGRVFAIRRDFEGQDLGIAREGGTSVIKEVKLNGLAARHKLPCQSPSVDGSSFCNWVLTEINNRPLNLFYKENEAETRLNAVGKDISILVQPLDLVKTIKKQLKSLRSYKEYIVQ